MKKHTSFLFLLLVPLTCLSMEQKQSSKNNLNNNHSSFLKSLAHALDCNAITINKGASDLEIIWVQALRPESALVVRAVTIKNFGLQNQRVHYYIMTRGAYQDHKIPSNHWFYKALETDEFTKKALEYSRKNSMGITFTQQDQEKLFNYASSDLFCNCTQQAPCEIVQLTSALLHYCDRLKDPYAGQEVKTCPLLFNLNTFFKAFLTGIEEAKPAQGTRFECCQVIKLGDLSYHIQQALVVEHCGTQEEKYTYYQSKNTIPANFFSGICHYPNQHWFESTHKNRITSIPLPLNMKFCCWKNNYDAPDFDYSSSPVFLDKTQEYLNSINIVINKVAKMRLNK